MLYFALGFVGGILSTMLVFIILGCILDNKHKKEVDK